MHGDTGRIPSGMGTYGSRSLAVGGTAIVKAVDKVIAKGKKIARAHLLEAADPGRRLRERRVQGQGHRQEGGRGEQRLADRVRAAQLPARQARAGPERETSSRPVSFTLCGRASGAPCSWGRFLDIEKLAHFDRERIPERVVHAKGAGAFGYFEATADMSAHTRAHLFGAAGRRTPTLVRFSTVGGEKGSSDVDRDPRGFAIKFYTEEGNYDLVGNNTPVFFIRDPFKFPDMVHTHKRNPQSNLQRSRRVLGLLLPIRRNRRTW